jgi:parvulin-like peptidyl-prolyl isomerase
MKRMNRLPIVLALAALAGACRSTPATPTVSPDAWAVVDGRQIMREDVEKAFRRTAPPNQKLTDEEALAAKLSLLNDLIVQDLLLAKAAELKIEVPQPELDAAYGEAKKNIDDATFEKELSSRRLTPADMREGLRRELLVEKVVTREITSKVIVSDQDVTAFFEANKASFNRPEEAYRIAQIVITPVREGAGMNRTGDDATSPQAANYKARMIMDRLKAGAAFSELAADFSEDSSAQRGGDLGFVPLSQLQKAAPPLRDAVLKTKPGDVQVVSAEGGHTLILVVGREPAGQRDPSMPEVKEAIVANLKGVREQLLRGAYLNALRNEVVIVNQLANQVVASQGKVPAQAAATAPAKP